MLFFVEFPNWKRSSVQADWVVENNRPGDDWPTEGHVVFHEYATCYRKDLDPVLSNINCDISGGEKVNTFVIADIFFIIAKVFFITRISS